MSKDSILNIYRLKYAFYVEMSPIANCNILTFIFQKFPGGGHAPRPPSFSMLCMLGSVFHTPPPRRLVP